MNLIEVRENRLEVWNKAKAFLDGHRKDGVPIKYQLLTAS